MPIPPLGLHGLFYGELYLFFLPSIMEKLEGSCVATRFLSQKASLIFRQSNSVHLTLWRWGVYCEHYIATLRNKVINLTLHLEVQLARKKLLR